MFRTSPVVAEDEWHLDLEVDGDVAVLTLNRPDKLNAWSWESTRQLGARADQIRFDERVRAVVLRGEGRAFCAGIDLGMPEDRVTGRSPAEKARNYPNLFYRLIFNPINPHPNGGVGKLTDGPRYRRTLQVPSTDDTEQLLLVVA